MTAAWLSSLFAVASGVWGIAYALGKRHGHKAGWYRGYDARKYETFDGENYR